MTDSTYFFKFTPIFDAKRTCPDKVGVFKVSYTSGVFLHARVQGYSYWDGKQWRGLYQDLLIAWSYGPVQEPLMTMTIGHRFPKWWGLAEDPFLAIKKL